MSEIEIGKESPAIVVEPLEVPGLPDVQPAPPPEPTRTPVREPEKEPVPA